MATSASRWAPIRSAWTRASRGARRSTASWTRVTRCSSTATCCTPRALTESDQPRWSIISAYNRLSNQPLKPDEPVSCVTPIARVPDAALLDPDAGGVSAGADFLDKSRRRYQERKDWRLAARGSRLAAGGSSRTLANDRQAHAMARLVCVRAAGRGLLRPVPTPTYRDTAGGAGTPRPSGSPATTIVRQDGEVGIGWFRDARPLEPPHGRPQPVSAQARSCTTGRWRPPIATRSRLCRTDCARSSTSSMRPERPPAPVPARRMNAASLRLVR